MAKKTRPLCIQCERRPGKVLKALTHLSSPNAEVYVNATPLPVFCSRLCACNYALLWVEGSDVDRLAAAGHDMKARGY